MTRRSPAEWMLAAEALVLLVGFRMALGCLPVRRIIAAITSGRTDSAAELETEQARRTARRVQWAVSAVARHSPIEFVCFPQALAGYTMLRRRGVVSTLVYGIGRSADGELMAHTWLMVGDRTVLGGDAVQEFTAIERWA